MARDWRRAGFAAFAAAMLGGACALGAYAQPADEDDGQAAASENPKGKKRQDPAEAQRAIEAALKQLRAGRSEEAVQALSATMAGGNLPPAILAKALYVRGMAHRRQGRPAQAISDLTSALWLRGGLGGDDRAEAIEERSAAYADAGLADPGQRRAPAAKTASGGGNWLSGLFGGFSDASAPSSSPPPAPRASASPVERGEPRPAAKTTAAAPWSKTEVQQAPGSPPAPPKARPPRARSAKARPPPEDPPGRMAEGRYLVQLGAVRTEAEAAALAARAKREHAAMLASRGQSIDRAVFGNMGAFYRVRFGPFASAQEIQTVCAKLQGSGIDCVPVSK